MTPDLFMVQSGILQMEQEEITTEQKSLLFKDAYLYLKAGGVITRDFWVQLNQISKLIFAEANNQLQTERAVAIGMSSQGIAQAAEVMAEADGGDAKIQLVLDGMMNRIQDRLSKQEIKVS